MTDESDVRLFKGCDNINYSAEPNNSAVWFGRTAVLVELATASFLLVAQDY